MLRLITHKQIHKCSLPVSSKSFSPFWILCFDTTGHETAQAPFRFLQADTGCCGNVFRNDWLSSLGTESSAVQVGYFLCGHLQKKVQFPVRTLPGPERCTVKLTTKWPGLEALTNLKSSHQWCEFHHLPLEKTIKHIIDEYIYFSL